MKNITKIFENKRIAIFGGTGSLGKVLVNKILSGKYGNPKTIVLFSRDEAKQYKMMTSMANFNSPTEDIIYKNWKEVVKFEIGDVRVYERVVQVLREVDILINTAALKQVPTCEFFPMEAVRTNILGANNIVRAIVENNLPVETVVGISTDKACKPVNVMGMTKAIQEKIFIQANLLTKKTRFICVRYGNVLASRGSVVPLFHEQIKKNLDVTITTKEMTRFLLSLDQAAELIFEAIKYASRGEIYIPKIKATKMFDLARALIGDRKNKIIEIGIRPGEKNHEILVSEEEAVRSVTRGKYIVIKPAIVDSHLINSKSSSLNKEYCSKDSIMSEKDLTEMLEYNRLRINDDPVFFD